jgi:hypothetical protein
MKWDMGWMHDTLKYFEQDPIHRKFHHDKLTFRQVYAFNENFVLPLSHDELVYGKGGRTVQLTNFQKFFWPELKITKGDLLQYYADVAPVLLPHIRDRAMVMKRYPHGADGDFFFMKQAPSPHPVASICCLHC